MTKHVSSGSSRMSFSVVGAGRVGPVLAAVLRDAGHRLVGMVTRSQGSRDHAQDVLGPVEFLDLSQACQQSDLVWLAVPDDALDGVVSQLQQFARPGLLLVHCCGSRGVEVFDSLTERGVFGLALHPAMTFSGTSIDFAALHGAHWAVGAPPVLSAVAQALVVEAGGVPHLLPDGSRSLYHAALSHGANHVAVLVNQALRALRVAGLTEPEQFLLPLVKESVQRAVQLGPRALSGPVARGDVTTVSRHLEVLEYPPVPDTLDLPPGQLADNLNDLPATYRAVATAALKQAQMSLLIDESAASNLYEVLQEQDKT